MAKKKQYKNVYTILEKVRTGELDVNPDSPRLYSNIKYNIRGEIVKPYLHHLDERGLLRAIDSYLNNSETKNEVIKLAKDHNKKLLSPDTLFTEMRTIWNKFPKEIVNDIFNLNYEDMENLKFETRTEKNKFRYHMLEKSNNPISKVITRKNHIKSMVYTRSMIQYFLMNLAMLQQEDKAAFDQVMKNLTGKPSGGKGTKQEQSGQGNGQANGQNKQDQPQKDDSGNDPGNQNPGSSSSQPVGQGNQAGTGNQQQSAEDHIKTLQERFDKVQGSQKIYDKLQEQAKKTTQIMEEMMSEKQMEDMWDTLTGSPLAGEIHDSLKKTNINFLETIEKELQKVTMNLSNVKGTIKKLLDKSKSYFSAKHKPVFESIFDSGTLDGLQDFELLHPKLRQVFMEDINVKDIETIGKIDIYVDASGSMNSSCGVMDKGVQSYLPKITFAKAFVYRMKQMNLLNNVYSFQHSVKYEGTSTFSILGISGGGGTSINKVVEAVERNGRNAIILTDAEDHCYQYTDKAFFIGVDGARFNYFAKTALQEYAENGQMVIFDGVSIKKVDRNGDPI